jgi:small nuclear ribonucleoprotein (snRNP)-like protein
VGFLKAFDIHFNLLLTDVDEEYSIHRRKGTKDANEQGLESSGEPPRTLKRCDIVNQLILYSSLRPTCVADQALLSNYIFSDVRHLPQLLVRGGNVIFMSSYRKSCISYSTMRNKLRASRNGQAQGSTAVSSVCSNLFDGMKVKRTDPAPDSTEGRAKRRRVNRGNVIVTGDRSSSGKYQGAIEDPSSGNSEQGKGSLHKGGPKNQAQRVSSSRAERERGTYCGRREPASIEECKRDSVVKSGNEEQREDLRYLDQDVKRVLDRAIDSYKRSAGSVKTERQRDRDDSNLEGKEDRVQETPIYNRSARKVPLPRDQTSDRKGLKDGHSSLRQQKPCVRECLSKRKHRHGKSEDFSRDRDRDRIDTVKNLHPKRDRDRDRDRVDTMKDHHPNRDRDRDRVDTMKDHHPNRDRDRDRDRDRVDTMKDHHPNRDRDRDRDRDRVDTMKDHHPNRDRDRDRDRDRVDTMKDHHPNRDRDRDRDRDRVDTMKDHHPNRDRDRDRDKDLSRTDS